MFKQNRKGIIGILLNPVVLLIVIAIVVVLLMFTLPISPFRLGILSVSTINFAGFTWDTEVNNHHTPGGDCRGSADLINNNAVLNLQTFGSSAGSECELTMISQTPINNLDEIEVVFSSVQSSGNEMSTSAGIFLTDKTRYSTRDEENVITKLIRYDDSISTKSSQLFDLKYVGFRNNHDGTYSLIRGTGINDLAITRIYTSPIFTTPLYLGIYTLGGGGAGGDKTSSTLTAYNVIQKVNGFAICKADEFGVDKNNDGKITPDECQQKQGLELLNKEEFEESITSQLARIETENKQKILDLQEQIRILQQQNKDTSTQTQITQLQHRLEDTNSILANVQAKNKNVIAVVQSQEQFQKPNFIITFFDKIIAYIKNLFI